MTHFNSYHYLNNDHSGLPEDGLDSSDMFPAVEESSFCSNFQCCGRSLKDLHELLQHYEDSHVRIEEGDDESMGAGMFDFDTVLAADSLLNVGAEASSSSRPINSLSRSTESIGSSYVSTGTVITPSPSAGPSCLPDIRNTNDSQSKRPRILTLGIETCDYASDDSEHLSAFDNTVIRPVNAFKAHNGHPGYARIAPKRSQSVPALPNFPLINGENGFKLIHSILSSTADPPSSENYGFHQASLSNSQAGSSSTGMLPSTSSYPSSNYSVSRSSNDRPFVCPINGCGKTYKNANGLKYHAIHGHDGVLVEKPHKCPFTGCGKRYKNSNGLKYHFQHAHPNAPAPSNFVMQAPAANNTGYSSYHQQHHYQQRPVGNYGSYSSQQHHVSGSVSPSSYKIPPRPNSAVLIPPAPRYSILASQLPPIPQYQQPAPTASAVNPAVSAENIQNLLASAPVTIANLLKKNPNLKQHLPTILRNLQQIALQKSNSATCNSSNEEKIFFSEKPPPSKHQ